MIPAANRSPQSLRSQMVTAIIRARGERLSRLVATLEEQFAESARLEQAIRSNLKGLGYGG